MKRGELARDRDVRLIGFGDLDELGVGIGSGLVPNELVLVRVTGAQGKGNELERARQGG